MIKRIRFICKILYARFLSGKPIKLSEIKQMLSLHKEDIRVISQTTNKVYQLSYNGKTYYFKECAPLRSLKELVDVCINEFFDLLSVEKDKQAGGGKFFNLNFDQKKIEEFKKYLITKKERKIFYQRLLNIPWIVYKRDFSVYRRSALILDDYKFVGLGSLPQQLMDIADSFIKFMNKALLPFLEINRFSRVKYNFIAADACFATYSIAKLLGLSNIIAKPIMVSLIIDKEMKIGVLSEEIIGEKADLSNIPINTDIEIALDQLNYIDVICCQYDHGPNNYYIVRDGRRKGDSVCAFDNDSAQAFRISNNINFSASWECSRIIDTNNYTINRPFIDTATKERLFAISFRDLFASCHTFLYPIQIISCYIRILKLRRAIINTERIRPDFSRDLSKISSADLSRELDGAFGRTYPYIYHNKKDG